MRRSKRAERGGEKMCLSLTAYSELVLSGLAWEWCSMGEWNIHRHTRTRTHPLRPSSTHVLLPRNCICPTDSRVLLHHQDIVIQTKLIIKYTPILTQTSTCIVLFSPLIRSHLNEHAWQEKTMHPGSYTIWYKYLHRDLASFVWKPTHPHKHQITHLI